MMFLKPEVLQGVFIPFLGTVLGSAFVFFLKGEMPRTVQRAHFWRLRIQMSLVR